MEMLYELEGVMDTSKGPPTWTPVKLLKSYSFVCDGPLLQDVSKNGKHINEKNNPKIIFFM